MSRLWTNITHKMESRAESAKIIETRKQGILNNLHRPLLVEINMNKCMTKGSLNRNRHNLRSTC